MSILISSQSLVQETACMYICGSMLVAGCRYCCPRRPEDSIFSRYFASMYRYSDIWVFWLVHRALFSRGLPVCGSMLVVAGCMPLLVLVRRPRTSGGSPVFYASPPPIHLYLLSTATWYMMHSYHMLYFFSMHIMHRWMGWKHRRYTA